MRVRLSRFQALMTVLILCGSLYLAWGCVPSGANPPALSPQPTVFPSPVSPAISEETGGQLATATPEPTPTATANVIPQYILEAELDYARHILRVNETINYPNPATHSLDEVVLVVEPNRYVGTFRLNSLLIAGTETKERVNWQEVNQLQVPLPTALMPGESLEIFIAYELSLPSPQPNPMTRPVPFGWTSLQTNLVDWYPFIPPYREGSGWLAHPPGYFGEHLVSEVADYQVTVRIKDPVTVRTTASSNPVGEPSPGQLTLAASAPAMESEGAFHFTLSKGRSFAWSVSHLYTVSALQVGDIAVYGYAFPAHRAAGEAALQTTAQALDLYQRVLDSSYPHRMLSVVEADFLDGMEFDGLVFLSKGFYNLYQGTPSEYLVTIAAHEAAHQWWYALIGNDQALDPWLDEALCTYSEKIYYENVAPEALPWWWTYRIDFYQPSGWINGSIYDYTAFPNAYEAYRNAVYLNGAKFFEELRQSMGDEAFFNFLRRYAQAYRHQIATPQSFLELLKAVSPQDPQPILEKYLR